MKRVILSFSFTAMLLAGAGTAAAAGTLRAAQPTPAPSPSASGVPSAAPSVSLDPNTAEVCEKSGTTVTDGITAFTNEIGNAGALAADGDLVGAEKSVKQSGTVFINLASKLRKDAEEAQKAELKSAIEDVSKELESLGASLTSLSSLQNFDTKRLEALSDRVAELCGGN